MDILVGHTGFVGSNLQMQHSYDGLYNSANISDAFGTKPELLVYSGVPSEMFTANASPEKDRQITDCAFENIKKIDAGFTVLISTVAVYDKTEGVDEDHPIDMDKLTAYGRNRLELEQRLEDYTPNHLIIRLPAIYGENLKKNFIYDYIHYIPALLKEDKYQSLSAQEPLIGASYADRGDGFYRCTAGEDQQQALKQAFQRVGFSALNFTDSRSVYQFLDLKYLHRAICGCMEKGIQKINLVTPPMSTAQVYRGLTGDSFENHCPKTPFSYDIKTKYTPSGYILSREQAMTDIVSFVQRKQ